MGFFHLPIQRRGQQTHVALLGPDGRRGGAGEGAVGRPVLQEKVREDHRHHEEVDADRECGGFREHVAEQ